MGNCSPKAVAENIGDPIRVMTDSGGVMEFDGPIQVRTVVRDFPGHGIFKKGRSSSPLFHHEQLFNGQMYYLLPLKNKVVSVQENQESRSESGSLASEPALEVLPSARKGVWRVKLVIDTKQLEEILSEEVNTEALIEKMRSTVASSSASTATPKRIKGSSS